MIEIKSINLGGNWGVQGYKCISNYKPPMEIRKVISALRGKKAKGAPGEKYTQMPLFGDTIISGRLRSKYGGKLEDFVADDKLAATIPDRWEWISKIDNMPKAISERYSMLQNTKRKTQKQQVRPGEKQMPLFGNISIEERRKKLREINRLTGRQIDIEKVYDRSKGELIISYRFYETFPRNPNVYYKTDVIDKKTMEKMLNPEFWKKPEKPDKYTQMPLFGYPFAKIRKRKR